MENLINRQVRPDIPFTHLEEYQSYAREKFSNSEWPTCREEPWRRTDISTLDFESFSALHKKNEINPQVRADKPDLAGYGYLQGPHTNSYHLDESLKAQGVFLGPLAQGINTYPDAYQQAFLKTKDEQDKFVF